MAKYFIQVTNSEDGKSSTATIKPFGRGKPTYDMLINECAVDGTLICGGRDPSVVPLPAAQLSPGDKLSRFYKLADGTIMPFGRGRPGSEKLSAECTATGEKVENGFDPNAPKVSSVSKVSKLEAEIKEMREMIAKMTIPMPIANVVKEPVSVVSKVAPAAPQGKSKAKSHTGSKATQALQAAAHFADDADTLENSGGSFMDGAVVFTDD